jgi:hypothetical protein
LQAEVCTKFILEEAAASFQLRASTANEVFAAPVQVGASTKFILDEVAASLQLPASTAHEVFAAPVQARASTNLPASIVNEVPTPVQAGVGTESILEEAAASFQFSASTANEVFAAPVQAGASTIHPASIANEVPTPVQAGVGTTFSLEEEAWASSQLTVSTANELFAAPVQAGASTKFNLQEAAASFQPPVLTAHEVFAAPVQAGASTNLPASIADEVPTPVQAGAGTEFILEGGGLGLISTSAFNCQ